MDGEGREQPPRVLQGAGRGLRAERGSRGDLHCFWSFGRLQGPAQPRWGSGAAGAGQLGTPLAWTFGPSRRWGSPGPEFSPSPSPSPGLSLASPWAAERGLGSSLLPRQSLSRRSSPSRPGLPGLSPSPSWDTGTQSCPRVAPGSRISRGVGVFLGGQSSAPQPPVRGVQRGGEKLLGGRNSSVPDFGRVQIYFLLVSLKTDSRRAARHDAMMRRTPRGGGK